MVLILLQGRIPQRCSMEVARALGRTLYWSYYWFWLSFWGDREAFTNAPGIQNVIYANLSLGHVAQNHSVRVRYSASSSFIFFFLRRWIYTFNFHKTSELSRSMKLTFEQLTIIISDDHFFTHLSVKLFIAFDLNRAVFHKT